MIEAQPIKLIEDVKPNIPACNLEVHNERVATRAGIPSGEPLPHLSEHEMREYGLVMHRKSGLPKADARRVFKQVRQRYNDADEVERTRLCATIRHAIVGLMGQAPSRLQESAYSGQSVVFDTKAVAEPAGIK